MNATWATATQDEVMSSERELRSGDGNQKDTRRDTAPSGKGALGPAAGSPSAGLLGAAPYGGPVVQRSPAGGGKVVQLDDTKPKPKPPEKEPPGTEVKDADDYVVAAPDANLRKDEDPTKFLRTRLPQGLRVKRVRELGPASRVTVQADWGGKKAGGLYWTSTTNLAKIENVKDSTLRWTAPKATAREVPYVKKGKGTKLARETLCYIIQRTSAKKRGVFVHVIAEGKKTSYGWLEEKYVLLAAKDRSTNFGHLKGVKDWTTAKGKVDPATLKQVDANRGAINDRTDKKVYSSNLRKAGDGYVYSDKSKDVKIAPEGKTKIEKESNGVIYKTLMGEGSWSSMNTWDKEVFTWGRGWAATGQLGQVIAELFALNPKYRDLFRSVGVDLVGGKLIVVDSDGTIKRDKSKAKGMDASKVIQKSTRLQSFFIELGEKKDFQMDVAKAQYRVLMKNAGKWPEYIVDRAKGTYAGKWSSKAVAMIAHWSHWLPVGSWKNNSYQDTNGEIGKLIHKFITICSQVVSTKHEHDVRRWKPGYTIFRKMAHKKVTGDFDAMFPTSQDIEFKKEKGKTKTSAFVKGQKTPLKKRILLPEGGDAHRVMTYY